MNSEEQINNGISAIDLGNCTQIIKEYYNISKNESLIILNIETKNERNNNDTFFNLGKSTQIEIYDFSGNKLDLSVCKENIKVMKYIGDAKELDIQSAKSLSEQGIDVFDASNAFFNDICYPYESPDAKDIILNDRRKDIYKNATFCEDGCSYLGMNYTLMFANCECDSSTFQKEYNNITNNLKSETVNFEYFANSFISYLYELNYEVIKCYNLAFNIKILLHNIGFFSLLIMIFLQIIFFLVYITRKIEPIKIFMMIFSDINKINKQNIYNNKKNIVSAKYEETDNSIDINKKYNNANKINKNKILKNKKFHKIKGKSNSKNNESRDEDNSKRKINNKNKYFLKRILQNKQFKNELNSYVNLKNNYKGKLMLTNKMNSKRKIMNNKNVLKDAHKLEILKNKKNNINKSQINKVEMKKLLKNDEEIQDMEYEEAILFDKRSYLRIYWSFLLESQIILETFCTENHLNLFVVKLSFFVYTFQISFFLNAFFYTDDYISDAYHNNGVLDFISGLPKSIYSFIATLITTNILKMLSNSKSELIGVIKRCNRYNNYLDIINAKMTK